MQQWKKRGTYHSVLEAIQEMSGLTEEELLSPSHIEPNRIQNIPEAAECIRACAITQGMPVVIVGDYDADGITSTAILVKLLGHFGVRTKTIIPKRFTDGYGISESLIQGITNSLIITIDNGVSAIEPIRAAKAAGNTVIVLDHHLPQDTLPEADLIVDPHIFPEKNGYEHYCGAGLAYKLAEFLCASESSQQKKGLFFDLLVLACIGTLADVVPLTGDNRYLVIAGLRVINHKTWFYQLSSGIQAILNLADRPYDEDTIKFQIAPILNAAGRLYNAGSSSVLKALLSEDDTQSLVFASKMKQINEERKRLVTHWLTIAAAAAEEQSQAPLLTVCCPGMPEGILGILAGKLAESFHLWKQPADTPAPQASPFPRHIIPKWYAPWSSTWKITLCPNRKTCCTMTWIFPRMNFPPHWKPSNPMPPTGRGLKSQYLRCETTAWSPKVPKPIARWENSRNTLSCLAGLRTP